MDQVIFTPDVYSVAGMEGSFPPFPNVEEDDFLIPFAGFGMGDCDLAPLPDYAREHAHWSSGHTWHALQVLDEGARPFESYSLPTDQHRSHAQSVTIQDIYSSQNHATILDPNSTLLYNDSGNPDDADGDLDTRDQPSALEVASLCDYTTEAARQSANTPSSKKRRKPRKRGNTTERASPPNEASKEPTKNTKANNKKTRRSVKDVNRDSFIHVCNWRIPGDGAICGQKCRIESDLKKHMAKHTRPHKCNFPGCNEDFTGPHDRKRHYTSKHRAVYPYRCGEGDCGIGKVNKKGKSVVNMRGFKRKDNFLEHCRKKHSDMDEALLLEKWYFGTEDNLDNGQVPTETVRPQAVQPLPNFQEGHHTAGQFNMDSLHTPDEVADHDYKAFHHSSYDTLYGYDTPIASPCSVYASGTSCHTPSSSFSLVRSCPQARLSTVSSMTDSSIHEQMRREKRPREIEVVAPRGSKRYRTTGENFKTMPLASKAQQSLEVPLSNHRRHTYYAPSDQTLPNNPATGTHASYGPPRPTRQRAPTQYNDERFLHHSLAGPHVNAPVHQLPSNGVAPSSSTSIASSPDTPEQEHEIVTMPDGKETCLCRPGGFDSKSNLKKHIARMTEAYGFGCTYSDCPIEEKPFGSKSDWQRHEQTQHHSILEQWRCNQCQLLFDEHQAFICHMRQIHPSSHSPARLDAGFHIHIAPGGGFWCGFCKSIQSIPRNEPHPMAVRDSHTAEHFMSESPHRIKDWELPAGGLTKGELEDGRRQPKGRGRATTRRSTVHDDHSGPNSGNNRVNNGSPVSGGDEDAEGDYDDDAAIIDLTDDHDPAFLPRDNRRVPVSTRHQPNRTRGYRETSDGRKPYSKPSSSTFTAKSSSGSSTFKASKRPKVWREGPQSAPQQTAISALPYRPRRRVKKTMFNCCQCKTSWSRECTHAVGTNQCDISGLCGHTFCDTCHLSDHLAPYPMIVPEPIAETQTGNVEEGN